MNGLIIINGVWLGVLGVMYIYHKYDFKKLQEKINKEFE